MHKERLVKKSEVTKPLWKAVLIMTTYISTILCTIKVNLAFMQTGVLFEQPI